MGTAALLIAAGLALFTNAIYFARGIQAVGAIETFRHNFAATLLMATLLGCMGLGTHLASKLRGVDGFLFIGAAVVQFAGLAVLRQPGNDFAYKPWFITHTFAFALSGAFFIAGGAAGVAYLLISRVLRRKRASAIVGSVAPLESLERFGRWMLMLGFPLFTYGILTGICELSRSRDPGPRAWLVDPLVVVSFVTWVVYAVMVASMWVRPEIRGRRAAALATCGMGLVAIVFLIIEFVSPLHR